MGQALTEEMVWKDGLLMTRDCSNIVVRRRLSRRKSSRSSWRASIPRVRFGAKECSEGSLAATIPAIANAIYDAVGRSIA